MEFETLIRGINFRPVETQVFFRSLPEGTPLELEREPGNRFDPNAIMVKANEGEATHFVGYIAKEMAVEIAPHLDEGIVFSATLGQQMDTKTWLVNLVEVPNADQVAAG